MSLRAKHPINNFTFWKGNLKDAVECRFLYLRIYFIAII